MKREVNLYEVKSFAGVDSGRETLAQALVWVRAIPNFAWLGLLCLTMTALSVSTLVRSLGQEREARSAYAQTLNKVESAKVVNQDLRDRTRQLKTNSKAGNLAAQQRLRLVRRNEVVIAVK